MELGNEGGKAEEWGPNAEQRGIDLDWSGFLHETVGNALANYGWYMLFGLIIVYLVAQKVFENVRSFHKPSSKVEADPDAIVRRQEAIAAARLRMQEELNAQAEKYKEKQKLLEEEKRRQKIESWESMKEGKSYKAPTRLSQPESPAPSNSAPSSAPNPKPERKPLRGSGYNPLTGDGGGTCAWRPGRRGPSSGG